jgi:hypothetical protein
MIATQDEDKQRKNTTQYVLDRTIHYIGLFIFLVIYKSSFILWTSDPINTGILSKVNISQYKKRCLKAV